VKFDSNVASWGLNMLLLSRRVIKDLFRGEKNLYDTIDFAQNLCMGICLVFLISIGCQNSSPCLYDAIEDSGCEPVLL
jgi:hypothetical protein